jgi:wyosine [tRNA(Phe)-imidazoG37] synthetase (radical SAM superfamily)
LPGAAFFLRAFRENLQIMSILPLFTQHSRSWQQNRYVYPVISRRSKGLSIGVNLNPDKICNFDCVYCCVDRTKPPTLREVDLDVLREELDHMLELACSAQLFASSPFDQTPEHLRRVNDVAFSGDGEPTSFQKFGQACQIAAGLLQKHQRPDIKIVVITNATLFHQKRVAEALAYLDQHNGEIWAKLDAGTEEYYRLIERTSIPLTRVLENILTAGRVRPIVIQSLFLQLDRNGPTDTEINAFAERLKDLVTSGCQIKLVQIYTVARGTAEAACTPLPAVALDAISDRVRKGTGLAVETYYGPS